MANPKSEKTVEREPLVVIRVVIESPFAGEIERNIRYAREAVLDCLKRGEAPYAAHLFFTQVLDDSNLEERRLGIRAGSEWGKAAEKTVVYTDYGISPGMKLGIEAAEKAGRPVEYRSIKHE